MTPEEFARATRLIAAIEADDIQQRLTGWERGFANSILDQWNTRQFLTGPQLEKLEEVVERHTKPRTAGRRYEGWTP